MSIRRFILTTIVGPIVLGVFVVGLAPKALGSPAPNTVVEVVSTHAHPGKGQDKQTAIKQPHRHRQVDVFQRLTSRIPLYVRMAFERVGSCESGGNIRINTGNGFYGWLQFTLPTWRSLGYRDMPHQASRAKQLWAGFRNARIQGWHAWPVCSVRAGATRINIRAIQLRRHA